MPTSMSEEIPLKDHYAVFRLDNGGLKVRKVRGQITRTSISRATDKVHTDIFHIVQGHEASIWAEQASNFVTVMEIDPATRPSGEYETWLQRRVRSHLNEWIV